MQGDPIKAVLEQAKEVQPNMRPYTAVEFLALDIPPRAVLLHPFLPSKGLAMLVAPRGVGKTLFSLTMAYVISSGESFLGFTANNPAKVIYIDGEMPSRVMQERLAAVVSAFDKEPPADDYFRILTSDLSENGLPDLSTQEGQRVMDAHIGDSELIVLDNLSTLVRGGKENEAESWSPIQDWILRLRREGRSVLMVHHAGKNGQQRGTSKREDVLDTVISLRRPADYTTDQGARFEVHFDKARGFYGDDAQPFEARYAIDNAKAVWSRFSIEDVDMLKVTDALSAGLSVRDAAKECGLSKSKVQRLKERAIRDGLYDAG